MASLKKKPTKTTSLKSHRRPFPAGHPKGDLRGFGVAVTSPGRCGKQGGSLFLTPLCSPLPLRRDARPWSRWLRSRGATRGASCTPASWTRTWWMRPIPWTPPSSVRQEQFHASPRILGGPHAPLGGAERRAGCWWGWGLAATRLAAGSVAVPSYYGDLGSACDPNGVLGVFRVWRDPGVGA